MLAHADAEGWVDMHPRAISEEVGLSIDDVNKAINELESPDPESRSPEEEGRRIVRLDVHRAWGWRIVNHGKYRAIRSEEDRREQNRLAQQRFRDKHKPPVSNRKQPSAQSAQAEAEAEAEADKTSSATDVAVAYSKAFLTFWELYPNRKNKGLAFKAFKKIKPVEYPAIKIGLEAAKKSPAWLKDNGEYIPHPSSWLNARGWEDEQVASSSNFNPIAVIISKYPTGTSPSEMTPVDRKELLRLHSLPQGDRVAA